MSETAAAPQITGKLFLFQQPELLNKEHHNRLGINRPTKPFAFCAKIRAVPITISEFGFAMKNFPIIFTGATNIVPLAVVGMIDDVNLFVDEAGKWEMDAYVPAYLRRYPFAFASESSGERLAVVIDRGFDSIAAEAETPFFTDGVPSEATQNAIEFCKKYEGDRLMTEQVMKGLEPFDIVTGQAAQFAPTEGAAQQTFAQYYAVDAAKLDALSDSQFLELRKLGLLPVIYAQLMSIGNWRTLFQRRARRFNLAGSEMLNPVVYS